MTSIFGSEKIIKQHISEADLKTYFVGFDLNKYRWDPLIDKIFDAIVDFAFGYHDGILENSYDRRKLREAAKSLYKIEDYDPKIHKKYKNEKDFFDAKYRDRGEFGELILHLLLRDFHETVCLISKIYFKDSRGVPGHGFDAVHINPKNKSLWLGESKLHKDGKTGVNELIKDVKEHFKEDYLRSEFALISKRKHSFAKKGDLPKHNHWFKLIDEHNNLEEVFNSVTIPLLCTYSCDVFKNHNSEKTKEFIADYEEEVRSLKKHFDNHKVSPIKTDLNIILLLFPIPDKETLVRKMHEKLKNHQQL